MPDQTRSHVPHDPPVLGPGRYGDKCADCDVPWPCPERRRQRVEKKAIDNLLRSALYDPDRSEPVEIDGVEAVRWRSPLRWSADLTYGPTGLVVVVHSYDGDHRSDDASAEWLDQVLP